MSSPLNRLYYGDNLEILRDYVADESDPEAARIGGERGLSW